MSLAHQDWNTIVLNPKKREAIKTGGKCKQPGHSLDDNKETFKLTKISRELSQEIIKKRCASKMDRKQLANKLNIKIDLLAKYESGTVVVDPKILNKIKKVLKIK